jgi:hypothetical protein
MAILIFGVAVYGVWWVCVRFQMPRVVFWVVGAILLLLLLTWISTRLGLKLAL